MMRLPWWHNHRFDTPAPDRSQEVIRVQRETTLITEQIRDALEDLSEIIGDEPTPRKDEPHE